MPFCSYPPRRSPLKTRQIFLAGLLPFLAGLAMAARTFNADGRSLLKRWPLLIAFAAFIVLAPSAAGEATRATGTFACSGDSRDWTVRQIEVGLAYTYAVSQRHSYYRWGRAGVLTRYRDPARAQILKRVAGYPVETRLPSWCIASVRIQGDWATIATRERWRARWSERSYWMSERRSFRIRLRELPGLVSQKWVVVSIS